ncbi:MAG: hypothetical protein MZW92_67125 [Comamonadaceae bacterium]|nr:hypothetical protein [Comamonadaceae bacterium]
MPGPLRRAASACSTSTDSPTASTRASCAASTTTRRPPSRSSSGHLGAQNAILGGGRYDDMMKELRRARHLRHRLRHGHRAPGRWPPPRAPRPARRALYRRRARRGGREGRPGAGPVFRAQRRRMPGRVRGPGHRRRSSKPGRQAQGGLGPDPRRGRAGRRARFGLKDMADRRPGRRHPATSAVGVPRGQLIVPAESMSAQPWLDELARSSGAHPLLRRACGPAARRARGRRCCGWVHKTPRHGPPRLRRPARPRGPGPGGLRVRPARAAPRTAKQLARRVRGRRPRPRPPPAPSRQHGHADRRGRGRGARAPACFAASKVPPFVVADAAARPPRSCACKYRYLDLRRPRHAAPHPASATEADAGRPELPRPATASSEIETPILTKPTPEGRPRLPRPQPRLSRAVSTPCPSRPSSSSRP